jgi:hypothetical protein
MELVRIKSLYYVYSFICTISYVYLTTKYWHYPPSTGTKPTIQIRTNRTRVRFQPLWDGIHDEGLDLEIFLASGVLQPQ